MDAYDLVISVFALNSRYENAVCGRGINADMLMEGILDAYPSQVLADARIKPHQIHGDSPRLTSGINELVGNGVVAKWSPGSTLTWAYPISAGEYFRERIQPGMDSEKLGALEEFAAGLR